MDLRVLCMAIPLSTRFSPDQEHLRTPKNFEISGLDPACKELNHNFDDLPALVFDGRMKTAGHWQKKDVPMSNLYLGLLEQFGAEADHFGESSGTLDLLT